MHGLKFTNEDYPIGILKAQSCLIEALVLLLKPDIKLGQVQLDVNEYDDCIVMVIKANKR